MDIERLCVGVDRAWSFRTELAKVGAADALLGLCWCCAAQLLDWRSWALAFTS